MNIDWTTIWQFLTATDERTWIGHGLQGVLFGLLGGLTGTGHGVLLVLGAFGHREANDYWRWRQIREVNLARWPGFRSEEETRRDRRKKLVDGFMDLWAPFAGAILAEAALLLVRP